MGLGANCSLVATDVNCQQPKQRDYTTIHSQNPNTMAEPIAVEDEDGKGTPGDAQGGESSAAAAASRKEKRKAAKKEKRKLIRKEQAEKVRAEEEALLNDPEEQLRIRMEEEREKERVERERREFEEKERLFLEELERKMAEEEEEARRKAIEEESKQNQARYENESNEDDGWEYVEEGPPEIIWQGNEIIVKKNRVRVKKKNSDQSKKEDPNRPTSNPLPPQSEAFTDYKNASGVSAKQLLEDVAQQVPNFGTEQDKAHCPFHIKTGACRFGLRCSRVHFYPDKSCTLLIKNMYNGPGLAWEQDEGLEGGELVPRKVFGEQRPVPWLFSFDVDGSLGAVVMLVNVTNVKEVIVIHTWKWKKIGELHTDEEVERCYEEFYEDVHTEFLKFGEIINFKVVEAIYAYNLVLFITLCTLMRNDSHLDEEKSLNSASFMSLFLTVCRNGSFHLRGNVYVHYRSLDSAVMAYQSVNGRFFAGKQVTCEFVSVTRWKVAICGEYMKSRLKTCSRGTACNFIHCFHNPGGDYEWADWDKPPPKYWMKEMAALFGYSDESGYDKQMEKESFGQPRNTSKMLTTDRDRYDSRRSRSRERESGSSSRSRYEKYYGRQRQRHTDDGRKQRKSFDDKNRHEERNSISSLHDETRASDIDCDGDRSDRKRDGTGHHDSTRRSSRYQINEREFQDHHSGSRSKTQESDSDRDDRGRDTHNDRIRKSSRHLKKVSETQDDLAESKSRIYPSDLRGEWFPKDRGRGMKSGSHQSDFDGDLLDPDREGDRSNGGRRKSSRHLKSGKQAADFLGDSFPEERDSDRPHVQERKIRRQSVSADHNGDNKSKTNDSGSGGDGSEKDPERHTSHTKKCSRHFNDISGLSDDFGEAGFTLSNKSDRGEYDRSNTEPHGVQECRHSSRRDRSRKTAGEIDLPDERLESGNKHENTKSSRDRRREKLHNLDSRYIHDGDIGQVGLREYGSEEQKRSKRKFTSDNASHKPDRSKRRSTSNDSGHYPNQDIDDGDRWRPDDS
ncbi:hypothetical protein RJ639_003565 [Escallonia herrerae]|uniref:C3H1-type domain-containing protein n=1 Tax=Escallonia herrerae TaxID=1293975 RepID=A0AA89AWW5_9ASTE|nr:hypothetical protein RJ639_003565 [Escallonia herrerae]